jgi:hypothetical protein
MLFSLAPNIEKINKYWEIPMFLENPSKKLGTILLTCYILNDF